ncbi:hypothetical protein Droror1_Dr00002491 [Drosera rotundifolia]
MAAALVGFLSSKNPFEQDPPQDSVTWLRLHRRNALQRLEQERGRELGWFSFWGLRNRGLASGCKGEGKGELGLLAVWANQNQIENWARKKKKRKRVRKSIADEEEGTDVMPTMVVDAIGGRTETIINRIGFDSNSILNLILKGYKIAMAIVTIVDDEGDGHRSGRQWRRRRGVPTNQGGRVRRKRVAWKKEKEEREWDKGLSPPCFWPIACSTQLMVARSCCFSLLAAELHAAAPQHF